MRDKAGQATGLRLCVYTRAWRTSGSGLFAQKLVLALLDLGNELSFVCSRTDDRELEEPRRGMFRFRPPREHSGGGSRLVGWFLSISRMLAGALGLVIARFRTRIFIFTIPDPLPFTILVMALLRLTGARIIFVVHDPLPHAFRLGPRWRGLEIAAHGFCYRLASALVVLSEPGRQHLQKVFPRLNRRVEVIDHGVFPLANCDGPSGTASLLVFGTIRRNKGIREGIAGTIIANRSGLPVRLLVAGEMYREEPAYFDECRALAATAPGVIELRQGYVADDDLPGLLSGCDAILMPYADFHSQSGVAILAASNGWPIVASRVGGIATLIDEGMPAQTIDDAESPDSIARAIIAFYSEPIANWRERAAQYRHRTMEIRSWPVIAARYLRLAGSLREGRFPAKPEP